MRGEGSNSFPSGNFYFNGELGNGQHNVVPVPNALAHDENRVIFRQFSGDDDFWLAQNNSQGSTENGPINQSLLLPRQEAGSCPDPHLDLNVAISGNDHASQGNGPYLSLDLFRTGTGTSTGNHHNQTSGGSSSPVMIYSGIAGYVLEENTIPTDGQRRLLCKRKTPQFDSGDGSSSRRQVDNFEQPGTNANLINSLNAANNSGPAVAFRTPSNVYQVPTEDRQVQVDNFQRNTRLRGTAGRSIHASTNSWMLNSNVQPAGQHPITLTSSTPMSMLGNPGMQPNAQVSNPMQMPMLSNPGRQPNAQVSNQQQMPMLGNPSMQPNAQVSNQQQMPMLGNPGVQPNAQVSNPMQMPMLGNPGMQPIAQVSNPLQPPQPSQYRNGTIVSRPGPSMSHDHTLNARETALRQAENLINNRRNMMISLSNMQPNMQPNMNLANGNANFIGNVGSYPRIQPGSGMHLQYSSMRSPYPEPWRLGNYCPSVNSSASPVVQDIGNTRPTQAPLRIGPRAERQAGHRSGVSPTVLSQTSAQRRRRLVSEVRNALGLVRRAGGLRIEDVMVIDRSFLYGIPEGHDMLEDMRIDVDNMSYEELLDLEEQIGNVSTGLTEEAIVTNLRRQKYQSITIGPPVEIEPCCICQEDYGDGEELGKLDCGHDFHFNCIKQWLVQKNSCPICKRTALAV